MKNGDLNKNENKASNIEVKLKVCGMNKNTAEVATLAPNYLGFIFWKPSSRCFQETMPTINESINKIGVFVDTTIDDIISKVTKFNLWGVQLHGNESEDYCRQLKKAIPQLKIIKVFSIKDDFDFNRLLAFETLCDFYLFDTKGKLPGGNGYTFDWKVLKNYPSTKPYFLSGGIGLQETEAIKEFLNQTEAKYCHAIDINSRFEDEPGLKNIENLKKFKKLLKKE